MMYQPITLFEHEAQPFDWTDRHLALIERLHSALEADVVRATVRRGERVLQATQYVGVVRLGAQTIQILPKIYRDDAAGDNGQRVRAATRNLLHLIAYAGQFDIKEQEVNSLLQHYSDWFEILTRLFALHLTEEWQRGPTRAYQVVEDELPALRGTWRIAQQIRRPERCHVFAVAYDEFTVDNRLNRVFRFVAERLWHLTRDTENRRILGDLRQWMDDVMLLPVVRAADAAPNLVSRLNRRYLPLLNLARLFLAGGALQLAAGTDEHFALLFDMNILFEAFIAGFINRHRTSILPPALSGCDLLVQTRGALRHLAQTDGRAVFRLEPDLAFRSENTFPLLLDTKYKPLNDSMATGGVSQTDIYQMYTYAQRYDCPQVLLLYPRSADHQKKIQRVFHLGDSPEKTITVATVDIRIDLGRAADRTLLVDELHDIFAQEAER